MEEDVDLRPYIMALVDHWKWIIGGALLVALVALGVSSLIPSTYEATVLVAVVEPRQVVLTSLTTDGSVVEPQFSIIAGDSRPLQAYPELAVSDELLQHVLSQVDPAPEDVSSIEQLRALVEVEQGRDPSLLHLSVRHKKADVAVRIVNDWANLFVTWANEVYGNQGDNQMRLFEDQLEQVDDELETAEQALVNFQAESRIAIIDSQLTSFQQTYADHLTAQRDISSLIRDIEGLRDQLTEQSNSEVVTFSEQFTAFLLQIKAFNAETAAPLQIQTSSTEPLSSTSRSEQVAFLGTLINTLEVKSVQINDDLAELEMQMLDLQRQKQAAETESERLVRNRDIAQETYIALARKVEEERVTAQDIGNSVRLASSAVVPRSVRPNRLVNTALAGMLGLVASVFVILAVVWWQASTEEHSSERGVSSNLSTVVRHGQ